ncbi:E3 ubiquitin ligase BIG BROTHER-related-like [Ananas comosus]|uniref:E3 ubiquitin ligase BIG BROTHER-related-like n=1 Tax=Ananas comosus TaxID=4615 RepID=A0A6P5ENV3_ANACO|nr:E3 ubiquitin ligase BIG BROTHER-related-like [Ananas comosus]
MEVEFVTKGKQQVAVHYVNAPDCGVVEENFGGYFHDHDDISLAEVLQDQEIVYQSLQRNVQCSSSKSSSNHDHGQSSSKLVSSDLQLAADEALARELEELENQLSATSFGDIRTQAVNHGTNPKPSSASISGRTSASPSAQVAREDDVDPDIMSYEELQQLGEAIGTQSRGLSEELISYLPSSTYKTGIFSKRDKHEECVICYMAYKNKDKLITLPCKHQYHKACATKWLKINKVCPICNEEVFGS